MTNTSCPSWWLYIVETDKGQLYTGISTDVERRFGEHQAVYKGVKNAKGAKFFRGHKPVKVCYREGFSNRSEASKAEAKTKKLSAAKKRELFKS